MTGRPAALSALALASTARVADSAMAAMRSEMRAPMPPSSQTRGRPRCPARSRRRDRPGAGPLERGELDARRPVDWRVGSGVALRKHARRSRCRRAQAEVATHRGVAQLVEHRSPKPAVAGSSPVAPAQSAQQYRPTDRPRGEHRDRDSHRVRRPPALAGRRVAASRRASSARASPSCARSSGPRATSW